MTGTEELAMRINAQSMANMEARLARERGKEAARALQLAAWDVATMLVRDGFIAQEQWERARAAVQGELARCRELTEGAA
jgi:hypothetical protein